jgi:galactokinase
MYVKLPFKEESKMTDEELNLRFAQMSEAVASLAASSQTQFLQLDQKVAQVADTVARLAESTDARNQELKENDRLIAEKLDRLVDGYLGLQQNLGTTSELLRQVIRENQRWRAEQEERRVEQERINDEFRQKHAESDQRFNVLLEEIRFLIRQQNRDVD